MSPFTDCANSELSGRLADLIVCAIKEQGQLPKMKHSGALFHQDFVKQPKSANRNKESNHNAK